MIDQGAQSHVDPLELPKDAKEDAEEAEVAGEDVILGDYLHLKGNTEGMDGYAFQCQQQEITNRQQSWMC